ncbi:MAG: hypothetical protein ABJC04_01470, partial [Verrucomicrobiota bacterium]
VIARLEHGEADAFGIVNFYSVHKASFLDAVIFSSWFSPAFCFEAAQVRQFPAHSCLVAPAFR